MSITIGRIHIELMIRRGYSYQTPKVPIRIIGANIKEIKDGTLVITIKSVYISDMGTTIATTSIETTMVTRMNRVGHIFHPKVGKLPIGIVVRVEDMMQKMRSRFEATNENA